MARVLKNKELINTRLATNYGGWMYCDNCGSKGSVLLDFEDSKKGKECDEDLIIIKNRLCCPKDNEPLITILDKKVASYEMKVTCKSCESIYKKDK